MVWLGLKVFPLEGIRKQKALVLPPRLVVDRESPVLEDDYGVKFTYFSIGSISLLFLRED